MKRLIRHHQNLLQMTNRRDCRKSIESSPGTTFPPYHNFYSIGGCFSEDMICTYIVSYKLTKIRLSATGNWISLFSIGTSIFSAIWRPVIFGTSGLGVLVELAKIECEFAMKVDEFEDSFCRGFSKQEPLLILKAHYSLPILFEAKLASSAAKSDGKNFVSSFSRFSANSVSTCRTLSAGIFTSLLSIH